MNITSGCYYSRGGIKSQRSAQNSQTHIKTIHWFVKAAAFFISFNEMNALESEEFDSLMLEILCVVFI